VDTQPRALSGAKPATTGSCVTSGDVNRMMQDLAAQ
jgi:hypothetical protein